jgi:hypothetical protein
MAIASDTNAVALGLVEETVFGTTPASPAWTSQRITGAPNLSYEPQTEISEEIRADRQVTDLILVGAEAGGDVAMELSFDAQENVIEGAMQNDWSVKAQRLDTQITDVAAGQYNVTDVNDAFAIGQLVKAEGFAIGANNATFRAETASDATTLVYSSALLEASPPSTASLRQVGFEGATGDLTTTAGGTNSINSTVLDFTTLNLQPGEWLKIGGTAAGTQSETAANNDWVRIAATPAITATTIVLDVVPSGWTTDTNAAKTLRVWQGQSITNASVSKSYSLEEQFTDHPATTYQVFTGMKVNTLSWELGAAAIINSTVNFMGKDASMSTTRTAGSTDIAATTSEILNTSSDVGRIGEAGVPVADPNFVLEGSININNNLRRQNAVGALGSVGIGSGEFNVTGSLNTYFGDATVATKVIDNTESSFDIRVFDADSQAMVFDLPKLKFSSGAPSVPGKNQDVTVPLEFQAYRDPNLGYTMLIQRFYEFEV